MQIRFTKAFFDLLRHRHAHGKAESCAWQSKVMRMTKLSHLRGYRSATS